MRAGNSFPAGGSPRSPSSGGSLRHCTQSKHHRYNSVINSISSQLIHFRLKVSAEKRLWKRLCRFHFSPHQINFILDEMAKQREKNAHNNHFNKNSNRSSRTLHPYLNNTNNNSNNNSNYVSRQNSVRSCDSNESTDHKPWVNYN